MQMLFLLKALHYGDNLVTTQHTLRPVGHAIRNVIDYGLFIVRLSLSGTVTHLRTSSLLALEKYQLNKSRDKYT